MNQNPIHRTLVVTDGLIDEIVVAFHSLSRLRMMTFEAHLLAHKWLACRIDLVKQFKNTQTFHFRAGGPDRQSQNIAMPNLFHIELIDQLIDMLRTTQEGDQGRSLHQQLKEL